MVQPNLDVLDANSVLVNVKTINPNGRVAATASQPITLCTEDKAVLDAVATETTALSIASNIASSNFILGDIETNTLDTITAVNATTTAVNAVNTTISNGITVHTDGGIDTINLADGTSTIILAPTGADASANGVARLPVLSATMGFNGTTWDRIRGTVADGLLVNLGANNDVTVASLPLPSGAATETTLAAINTKINTKALNVQVAGTDVGLITNSVLHGLTTAGGGSYVDVKVTPSGALAVDATLSAGTALVGIFGIDQDTANANEVVTKTGSTTVVTGSVAVTGTFFQATQPVSAASLPLPSGAATAALQTQPGVDIGDVTINNAAGAAAVNVQDGGNSITVDGTVAFSNTTLPVTNAGTFVVQENGAALTSLQLLDDVVITDDAAFTPAVSKVAMVGFTFDDVTPDSVNEGDAGAARMSANRNIYTTIRDAAGNERGLNVAADGSIAITVATIPSHAVTNAGTFAVQAAITAASGSIASGAVASGAFASGALASGSVASGAVASGAFASGALASGSIAAGAIAAGATSIAANEDDASADLDRGVKIMARRTATPANTSGTDLDYEMLQMNGGRLWASTLVTDGTTTAGVIAGTTALKTDTSSIAGTATVTAGVNGLQAIGGAAAHAASISGNPVRNGLRALTADYTAVTTGQTADAISTILGKQVTMPYALPGASWRYVGAAGGIVNTTGITLVAAGGAGIKQYITSISLVNSHQTIGTEIVIRNVTTTATTVYRAWCQFAGGGVAMNFVPPLASIANEGLEILEVTATGTAGVVATVTGYTAAE